MRGLFLAMVSASLALAVNGQTLAAGRTYEAAAGIRCPWPENRSVLGRDREDQIIERLAAARDQYPRTEQGLSAVERAFASIIQSYSSSAEQAYAEQFSLGMLVKHYQEIGLPARAVEYLNNLILSFIKSNRSGTEGLYLLRARLLEGLGRDSEALFDLHNAQALGCTGSTLEARMAKLSASLSAQAAAAQRLNERIEDVARRGTEAEQNQDFRSALAIYVSELATIGSYGLPVSIVIKAVDAAAKISPPPPIPEEARKHVVFGQTAFKEAQSTEDFAGARAEYTQALALAPWWADVWVTLSAVEEKLGNFAAAASHLEVYLHAASQAADREEVQNKIYELQFKAQRRGSR